MSDVVLILSGAISLLTLVLLVLIVLKRKSSDDDEKPDAPAQPRGVPRNRDGGAVVAPRRAGRNIRSRMRAAARQQEEEEEIVAHPEDDEEEDYLADEIALPEGKIGAKKRRKLEMKAEKKLQREREMEEREERRQRELLMEAQRKRQEEMEKAEEAKREEEERRLKEEKERQELEEYLKLKEAFTVDEEGFDEDENEREVQNKFQAFIDYIKTQKVVLLEDLAAHFKLKTQDCIQRVQDLLAQEQLVGVIDDRGKFIYITLEELESVAKFIQRNGRVSISELVENSNKLINLLPDTKGLATKGLASS